MIIYMIIYIRLYIWLYIYIQLGIYIYMWLYIYVIIYIYTYTWPCSKPRLFQRQHSFHISTFCSLFLFPSQLCLQPRPGVPSDAGGKAPLLLWRALRLWTADPWAPHHWCAKKGAIFGSALMVGDSWDLNGRWTNCYWDINSMLVGILSEY